MRNLEKYKGVIPAFYACYDEEGDVSPERVQALTRYFVGKGVKGVYVGGSSGECIYQSVEDRKITLENVMKAAEGKLTVIAHVACNSTRDSVELARHAESLGVDAIAAIPPIYFHLPEHAIAQYWNDISAAAQSTLSTGLNSVAASWTLDIQARLTKKELSMEKQTKIGQYVSLIVGVFSIVVAIVLANGGVKSAYEWFNGFMGLVLGILIGTFILGAFTKVANTFGATLAFIAASSVMIGIKYFAPAGSVSIWSYSIISIAVSLVVGIPASLIWRRIRGDNTQPAPYTTIYRN